MSTNSSRLLDIEQIKKLATEMFWIMQPYCVSIYLGGSICEGIINNPHDIDFICFVDYPRHKHYLRMIIHKYIEKHQLSSQFDFIQIRVTNQEEHAYGSYINKKMILLVGRKLLFHFDVINLHRDEYKQILISTINDLNNNKIQNKKRWYQVVRGFYILKNNSYALSEQEKEIINIIHDQSSGWEKYKITMNDVLKY